MHELCRQVRFSISPFLDEDTAGFNSYCSKPCAEGLAIFFELCVVIAGPVRRQTGFVVNVVDIDKQVRKWIVPMFASRIREAFRSARHVSLSDMAQLLVESAELLSDKFETAKVTHLFLDLNPYRNVGIILGDDNMLYYSEKFEFAAMHKLWNNDFSHEQNFMTFGKCANPTGHGHNYILEVKVRTARSGQFRIGSFEETVSKFVELMDHKNLNLDVAYFSDHNPTVENIAVFAWESLAGRFDGAELAEVTVWETQKTSCTYRG